MSAPSRLTFHDCLDRDAARQKFAQWVAEVFADQTRESITRMLLDDIDAEDVEAFVATRAAAFANIRGSLQDAFEASLDCWQQERQRQH